jgi:hypothetical protein
MIYNKMAGEKDSPLKRIWDLRIYYKYQEFPISLNSINGLLPL